MAKVDKQFNLINKNSKSQASGAYFLGMIGSAFYMVSVANGFGEVLVAMLKALVWPAFLVNRIFELLQV